MQKLLDGCGADIGEFVAVISDRTTPESLGICSEWESRLPGKFRVCREAIPGLGGALRKGFEEARGSHILVVFSDGESDPASAPSMISASKQNPSMIISASRWMPGGSIRGYGLFKWAINFLGQRLIGFLYQSPVTDYTFGYRLYRAYNWKENTHSFVLESILKPIRTGVSIIEIPSQWKRRSEGKSQMSFFGYLRYVQTAWRYRRA
jgi:hypothetical protein